ncbi:Undecaprenyl-phosphate mannosyltransferase [bioreactor metagenome]|uniref:Undecaprenyl-phosphate mannosyltransferase n=1 Tax=bioreactor metagenome TaxID=1076179 RepID=A0A645B972_9ZZZZ
MASFESDAKLSIVIPVYNEERTLELLLEKVHAVPLPVRREIIIVDDGSTDDSGTIAERWAARHRDDDIRLLRRSNGGKGAAVRDGIAVSTGDVVIIQDADLEYDPGDIAGCIAPILEGRCAVVYGSRERERHNMCSSWRFYAGGLAVTWWIDCLYWVYLTDEPTCYKTFRGDLIRALDFENDDFGWEPEVTCKLLRLGWKILEVPISYRPRHVAEGKKIRCRDGLRALQIALEWRFRSIKKWRKLKFRQTK